jgi:hypothetical protein
MLIGEGIASCHPIRPSLTRLKMRFQKLNTIPEMQAAHGESAF